MDLSNTPSLSLSLCLSVCLSLCRSMCISQRFLLSFVICFFFLSLAVFYSIFLSFLSTSPRILQQPQSVIEGVAYICVSFIEFPSLVCWCTVIHHLWPHRLTLFRRKMGFLCVQCNVYTFTGPLV